MVATGSKQRNKKSNESGLMAWVKGLFNKPVGSPHMMSFEIDELTKKFKINEEAKRLGKMGLPAFHAKDLTSVETELLRHLNVLREQILINAENEIAAIDRQFTDKEHEFQRFLTQSLNVEFERKARQIMDTQGAWLKKLASNAIANIKELEIFREENNLKRQANYPEKSQAFLRYTLLLVLIIIEGSLNATFFSEGVSTGLIGGFIYAASLALINISGCFFIGKIGVRWINHNKAYGKIIGGISLLVAGLFLGGMALSIAHIREAMAVGVDNPTQAAWNMMQSGLWSFKDLTSWFLIMLTLGFGIAAVVDGVYVDDIYPGYGSIFRRTESAKEEFESEFEEIRYELEELKQEKLDFIDQQLNSCNELLFSVQNLLETKKSVLKKYQDKLNDSEVVLFATIRKFRFENEIVREDGLIPAYFNTMPSLNPITLPKMEQARESALIGKLNDLIRNHEKTISRQREEVYQIFEKFVTQLNHLRYY